MAAALLEHTRQEELGEVEGTSTINPEQPVQATCEKKAPSSATGAQRP